MRNLLIITGGGTGGHILAGLAIIEKWTGDAVFVGAKGGLEEKLVPQAGVELKLLKIGALKGVSKFKKIKVFFQIPFSVLTSLIYLIKKKPACVIGVGGFASGPFLLAATLYGLFFPIKTAIVEQNAAPGFTNKILGKFVKTVFLAFSGTTGFDHSKTIVTGNPIRKIFSKLEHRDDNRFTIFIFGGSQGAKGINEKIVSCLPILREYWNKIDIIHQTGPKDFDRCKREYEKIEFPKTQLMLTPFIDDMKSCYEIADLVISRAGSSSLSEIAAVGRASILIPYPFAADDHQKKNAVLFLETGAASLFEEKKESVNRLASLIEKHLKDETFTRTMEKNALLQAKSDSADLIVRWISDS